MRLRLTTIPRLIPVPWQTRSPGDGGDRPASPADDLHLSPGVGRFSVFVLAMLAVHRLVLHGHAHEMLAKEAGARSIVWIAFAVSLAVVAAVLAVSVAASLLWPQAAATQAPAIHDPLPGSSGPRK